MISIVPKTYAGIDLYYKLPGVEDKDTSFPIISKPTSHMNVSGNNQSASDGQTITSTVGKSITIDFNQSISNDAPIAEVGLQITNGTGNYQNCWTTLPNGFQQEHHTQVNILFHGELPHLLLICQVHTQFMEK